MIEGKFWITICVVFWLSMIVMVSAPWVIPYALPGVTVSYEMGGCQVQPASKEGDMFDIKQFADLIVFPVLYDLGLHSRVAEKLVLGTIAQESNMGTYLKQVRGPALGIGQMERETHNDIIKNFLRFNENLRDRVLDASCATDFNPSYLVWNLRYAVAFVRIQYYRVPAALPESDDVNKLAAYWKKHYNTRKGKGTKAQFKKNYLLRIEGET